MKRILFIIAVLLGSAMASAQQPQALPNDPEVRTGKLDNGLTYYIRHNEKPAQRAEFYLATDVGAFQETDDQDGLAHFLEHMCFNGTKNFPGKALLDWLQSIGAEFGRNINASTGFEQTQYMLNNIPITRESIIDSCLLVLHDYSHFVTCDPAEIDAERGVILEERRTRRDADWRMFEKALPYYYGDTPYSRRTLIGGEEQLKTFRYESLTDFYHKWYRPDMQAVIVIGDVDPDKVEQKIKAVFSDIPAPEVPTEKPLYELPQHKDPVVGILTDAEATGSSFEILWKTAPLPKELNNTDFAYMIALVKAYTGLIMRERINDITSKPDAPFISARFGIGGLCYSSDAVFGGVTFKEGEAVKALTAYLTEVEKMKRYGFTEGEIQRAKDKITSSYEKAAEAASTRSNSDFVRPLLDNFYENEPYMDPQMELEMVKVLCSQINADLIRQFLPQLYPGFYAGENAIILFNGPEKEGLANPTEEEVLGVVEAVKSADIAANAEETVNEPLLDPEKLKGSKVKKEGKVIYDAVEWTLKNGVKVVVLPTDYRKDQIIFNLALDGGKTLIATEDLPSFEDNIWTLYLRNSGISKFPGTTISKMLAGKNVSAAPYISSVRHGINGSSSPKDLETALQLTYLLFTDPRFDEQEWETGLQQIRAVLPNLKETPDFKFQTETDKTLYDNNPRVVNISDEVLEKASLATLERVYRNLFSKAGGATLYITGNVDLESLKPLVEKYIGSLPKGKGQKVNQDNVISFAKSEVKNKVKAKMQTPKSTVLQLYSAYMPIDTKTEVVLEAAKYVLDMTYTKTIREQEGGTYGVGVSMAGQRTPEHRALIQVYFDTNPESAEKLSTLAHIYLKELAENGPSQEELNMALENLRKNLPESRISNSYWMNALNTWYRYGIDYDAEYEAAVNSVTTDDVKTLLQQILAQNNTIEVMLVPEE